MENKTHSLKIWGIIGLVVLAIVLTFVFITHGSRETEPIPTIEPAAEDEEAEREPALVKDSLVVLRYRPAKEEEKTGEIYSVTPMPCGGPVIACQNLQAARSIAVKEDLSETQLDTIWQQYIAEELEKVGDYTLEMTLYEYNGSDYIQDYWSEEQKPIAEYHLPEYLELELNLQDEAFQASIAIISNQESDLEKIASNILKVYDLKLAPSELTELTIFEYNDGDSIGFYGAKDMIWHMSRNQK